MDLTHGCALRGVWPHLPQGPFCPVSYHAGASPDGSVVHVSIWESDEHAQQMSRLKEMIVDARQDAEKAGVTFIPIVNYPIDWTI